MKTVQGRETDFQVATKKCFKWIKWWRRKLATPHSRCNKQQGSDTSPPGSNMSYREGDRKREMFESTFCRFGAKRLRWLCTCRVWRWGCKRNICLLVGFTCSSRHLVLCPETNGSKFSLDTLVFQPSHGALVGCFLAIDSNRQSWWKWRIWLVWT